MNWERFWHRMGGIADGVMTTLFLLLMLLSAYSVYDTIKVYDRANDKTLLQYKPKLLDDGAADDSQTIPGSVAWITIDNTTIDYPIMQAEDNAKYLNTDPYGKASVTGSIFLDARNASDFSDSFNLVYGHHVEGKTMFGALDAFADQSYLEQHSSGTLIVDSKVYTIHPFALCTVSQQNSTIFGHPETTSIDDVGLIIQSGRLAYTDHNSTLKILALSTCKADPSQSDERTVLFCTMTDQ